MKHLLLTLVATVAVSIPALASQELADANKCKKCHHVDIVKDGPSFKQIAKKYAGQAGIADKLVNKVMKGSAGVWGKENEMPENKKVTKEDAKTIVEWILTLK